LSTTVISITKISYFADFTSDGVKINSMGNWFKILLFISVWLLVKPEVTAQDIFINEVLADNYFINVDDDFSTFSDWIELANISSGAINIGGYFITDNIDDTTKWQIPSNTNIPAGGFMLFWCDAEDYIGDALHTNFRLDKTGEQLLLFNENKLLVDSLTFGDQADNTSFGRQSNGSSQWFYFAEPTPGSANTTTGVTTTDQAPDIDFSLESGLYNDNQFLEISLESGSGQIRYTADGSMPHSNSTLYQGPVSITSTKVIRAKAFLDEYLPGDETLASFIINEETDLPLVSVIIEPEFLWDTAIGIYNDYMIGARRGWERPARIEYFDKSGDLQFDKNSIIRLYGRTAIYYPEKSLAVFPNNPVSYPLFDSRENENYHSFILRSSSDDWPRTMMRDALMQSVFANHLNLDYQAYEPSIVYLNGEYFGIHNIREKFNEDFLETHHNVSTGNLDFFSFDLRDTSFNDLQGIHTQFEALMEFVADNDMTEAVNYEMVKSEMDIDNYIDFLVANFYFINTSWHHNIKLWKDNDADGKWRWMVYDLDRGMQTWDLNKNLLFDIDTMDVFFQHLRQNDEFKYQYINRCKGFMNHVFYPDRISHFIDSVKMKITSEMPSHIDRWKDECDPDGQCGVQSMDAWNTDLNTLYSFNQQIQDFTDQHITDFFGIENEQAELTINIEEPNMGKVYINNVHYPLSGDAWQYFKQLPLQLTAISEPGYLFTGWEGISYDKNISVSLDQDKTITARFGAYCNLPEHVSSDLTLSDCSIYLCESKLVVDEGVTLTVDPGVQIWMPFADSIIINGSLIINGTETQNVVLRPDEINSHWGTIYTDKGYIELNYTEIINGTAAVRVDSGEIIVRNCFVPYNPFIHGDIFSIHKANTIIENCIIYGPDDDASKTDVIDCDEVNYAYISGNTIYGTTDDGIDIGTHSNNITIENNMIYDCFSMGISVGEGTVAQINYNIVVDCEAGIQIHSGATGYVDHNTVYNNEVGIRCFHYENQGSSGGHAIVSNSIISQSTEATYLLLPNSEISFEYSLSDTDVIPGEQNLNEDPQFIDAEGRNFYLLESSPCIDAGSPDFDLDPNGTITDMGALYYLADKPVSEYQLGITPNPSYSQFRVFLADENELIQYIYIYNIKGENMYHQNSVYKNDILFEGLSLRNGVYMIRVVSVNGNRYIAKLVIL